MTAACVCETETPNYKRFNIAHGAAGLDMKGISIAGRNLPLASSKKHWPKTKPREAIPVLLVTEMIVQTTAEIVPPRFPDVLRPVGPVKDVDAGFSAEIHGGTCLKQLLD
jgi:hypothetical protein